LELIGYGIAAAGQRYKNRAAKPAVHLPVVGVGNLIFLHPLLSEIWIANFFQIQEKSA
jgi:hypothetical protein